MAIASKKQIDKAGVVLAASTGWTEEYIEALQILARWRLEHEDILHFFQSQVKSWLHVQPWVEDSRNLVIAARIKRLPSIIKKIRRFPNLKLSSLQDLVGIRVILPSIGAVRDFEQKALADERLVRHKDYIHDPKSSGYRGIHLVYKMEKTQLELQVRTWRQHQWATAVEAIGVAMGIGDDIKTSESPKEWEKFFALMSSVYARQEVMPSIHPDLSNPELPNDELRKEVTDAEKKLQLLNKWSTSKVFDRVSPCNIKWAGYDGDYTIIKSNTQEKVANLYTYTRWGHVNHDLHIDDCTEPFEKELHQQDLAVFMEARHIQRAYPNYFMDVQDFLHELEVFIRKGRLR